MLREMAAAPSSPDGMVQLRVLGGAMAASRRTRRRSPIAMRRSWRAIITPFDDPTEPRPTAWTERSHEALGANGVGVYSNFLEDEGEERIRAAYPAGTYERLAEIKRRYDPANLFRLNQNIRPRRRLTRAAWAGVLPQHEPITRRQLSPRWRRVIIWGRAELRADRDELREAVVGGQRQVGGGLSRPLDTARSLRWERVPPIANPSAEARAASSGDASSCGPRVERLLRLDLGRQRRAVLDRLPTSAGSPGLIDQSRPAGG